MDNPEAVNPDEPTTATVDGEVMSIQSAQKACVRMFYAGFFFLPLLWIANVWLFWPDFINRQGDPVLRKYTRWSAIAATVATAIFLPWLLLYAIDGQRILDPKVYDALDAASLDLSAYGFGIVQNSPT